MERQVMFRSVKVLCLVLILVICCGAMLRIRGSFSKPGFDFHHPEGMLMSDPALLFYVTERIVDNHGLPPADFRVDTRVEHPVPDDLPAMFTVGQEFYLAWGYLLFGKKLGLPLHVYIVIAMSFFAALAAIGVCGLARELTGNNAWAIFACLAYAVTLANYRTLGFILVREDFSLPLFSLHLWLVVRAARVRTPAAFALASFSLLAAVATWHAMVFICAIEMAVIFAWYLRTGENLLAARGGYLMPLILAAGSFAVPVLLAKWFVLSLPMQILLVLTIMALIERRRPMEPWMRVVAALGFQLAFCAVFFMVYPKDYSHVFEFIFSKLTNFGIMPQFPDKLGFGARLLWQGPFETASFGYILSNFGVMSLYLAAVLFFAWRGWTGGRGDGRLHAVAVFALVFVPAAFFVKRLVAVEGLVAPAVAAVILSRLRLPLARWAILVTIVVQAALMAVSIPHKVHTIWYPQEHRLDLKQFIRWTNKNLDDNGAIAADFMNSPAILAHTGHPVALQPKYETRASRERIRRFLYAFYHGTPWDLHKLMQEWDCRYLLVDVRVMSGLRYVAGINLWEPPPMRSAAAAFLSAAKSSYAHVPGFIMVYGNRQLKPTWRLYRVE